MSKTRVWHTKYLGRNINGIVDTIQNEEHHGWIYHSCIGNAYGYQGINTDLTLLFYKYADGDNSVEEEAVEENK